MVVNDSTSGAPVLSVEGLSVEFPHGDGWLAVVEDLSLTLDAGETLGIVGESGSGKTVSGAALMGLLPILGGRSRLRSYRFMGMDLSTAKPQVLRSLAGSRMGMVFQQPTRSLNPAFTIGDQIASVARRHLGLNRADAWQRAVRALDRVGIPQARSRAKDYPHRFSGGMCQRVMIAMALVSEPNLLIADEPTTALDVTVQAKLLDLLREIQEQTAIAILFITHDLAVVGDICDRVMVMYAGQVVETQPVRELFRSPRHPYTDALVHSVPRPGVEPCAIPGAVPTVDAWPRGCRFHPRCAHFERGTCDMRELDLVGDGNRLARCARLGELSLPGVLR